MKKKSWSSIGTKVFLKLLIFSLASSIFISTVVNFDGNLTPFPNDKLTTPLSKPKTSAVNIELISESNLITKWDFINESAGFDYVFNENFETGSDDWSFSGVGSETLEVSEYESGNYLLENYSRSTINFGYSGTHFDVDKGKSPSGLAWDGTYFLVLQSFTSGIYWYYPNGTLDSSISINAQDRYMQGITWDGTNIWTVGMDNDNAYKYTSLGVYVSTVSVASQDTVPRGITWDGTNFWLAGDQNNEIFKYTSAMVYTGVHWDTGFSPTGIMWDGTYFWVSASGSNVYRYTSAGVYTGVYIPKYPSAWIHGVVWDGTYIWTLDSGSDEMYKNSLNYIVSKYYNGDGYFYIQTDETETLTIRSPDDLDLTLQEGDKIETIFNTSSTNRIDLNLLNNSVEIESYILSEQGNGDFSTRTKTFSITSNISVDQIEFTGNFVDTKNLFITNITIIRPIVEVLSYYVEPYGRREVDIGIGSNYTVEVYERNELKDSWSIFTTSNIQTLIYEIISVSIVYVSYYDLNNDYLFFNNYISYVNYTLDNFTYIDERMTSNIMYVDKNSLIQFNIYDSFNALVKSFESYEETFIDLVLNVYSLKIKNEAEEYVEYDLSKSGSSIVKSGNIFPEEIIEFSIATGDYYLDYINHEDSFPRQFNFTLSTHKLISINTTYHSIYFGVFTYDGLGIDHDLVRFYINEERRDFGLNTIQSETANLLIFDYFNNTLANDTIDARAYSEYNLFVEIYSLIILNQFTYEDIIVNITQVGSGVYMTQVIPKQFGLSYRFLPNVEYNITIYFTDATLYSSRIVNLTDNNHIESFGVATVGIIPEYPKDVYFSVYTGTGLSIQQQLMRFYIDGDRSDFGFNTIEDMIITIVVKDFFNTTIFNQIINTSGIYEYDILIDIYSLKIKNEAEEIADYNLILGILSETGKLFPEEIVEYQLSPTNYTFNWINNEDNSNGSISVNLNQDRLYIVNSTYYDVYIGLYNFYGIVNDEEVRFYINETRTDFGFNTIKSKNANLKILDYFNSSLYDTNVLLFGLTEFSIFVRAYTLVINNNYTHSIKIQLTRGSITVERLIEAQGYTEFKLFPNIKYEIESFYINETSIEEKDIDLDEEYKVVSFGFYETLVPISPLPILNSVQLLIWFGFFIIGIAVVVLILYYRIRGREPKVSTELKELLTQQSKKKKRAKKGSFSDDRDIYIDT